MKELNKKRLSKMLLLALVIFICMMMYFTVWYMRRYFPNWHMRTVLYAFNGPYHHMFIKKYLKQVIISALGIAFLVVVSLYFIERDARKRHYHYQVKALAVAIALLTVLSSVHEANSYAKTINLNYYLNRQLHPSSFVRDHYVDPAHTKITFPKKKRNVIYVYLESMERSYMDRKHGGDHNVNLIPELTKLAQENNSFSDSKGYVNGAHSLTGTTWTIGGIVAATSGLYLSPQYNNNEYNNSDVFYPTITNFGDLLHKQGYKQVFLLGSDAYFGGRDRYFRSHGHYEVEDYLYAKKHHMISKQYKKWWGYEDEKLFGFAKKRLNKLGKSSQPFNFTMLTVDTHYPNGWKCDLCKDEFGDQYHNVMACSSRQVYAFVKWCQSQSWYKNTTIIVNGDHPTMSQEYANEVSKDYTRKTFTAYINADAKRKTKNMRTFSTMDNFPTTLAALGVKIDGERLGLGTNLFSSTPTLSEIYGYASIKKQLTHATKELIELEPFENTEAIQQFQYGKAKAFGHKDILTIKKVEGTKVTVDITDFRPQKVVSKVYLEASNDMSMPLGTKKVEMKCLDPEKLTYEGTIDVKGIDDNGVYVQVMYESDEGMQFPLNRTYVDLTGNSTNTTTDTTATN